MLELPAPDDVHRVADWVELSLAVESETLSRATLGSVIESATGYEPGENFVGDVWRQLTARANRYVRSYYDIGPAIVRRGPASSLVDYRACLLFSTYGVSDELRSDPKLFERLTARAIKRYLDGDVFVFGWPPMDGVEPAIAGRVRQCAEAMGERFAEAPGARYKDRGVDVVAWRSVHEPASDRRSGKIVMLSQCAAGSHWRSKTTELPFRAWSQYIHWAAEPICSFALPSVVPDDLWHDVSREAGVVFDRIRIANLLGGELDDLELMTALQGWVGQAIEGARLS